MRSLLYHARNVAAELASRLFDGETAISPTRESSRTSCEWCDYRAVCRFDCESPDAPFRDLPAMSMDDMRAALAPDKKQF